MLCHVAWAEVTAPTFSTESNPVWYYIQFNAGKNSLDAPEDGKPLKTALSATQWQLVGNEESFYLKSAKGDYVGFSVDRFTATTEDSKVALKLSVQGDYYNIQRIGGSGMNQHAATTPGVELAEYTLGDGNNALSFVEALKASPAPQDGQWAEGTTWYQIKTGNGYYLRSDVLHD